MADKLFAAEFESNFLGMCLVDSKCFQDASFLASDDFGTVNHQLIYSAMASLYEAGKPTDAVFVASELDSIGELSRVGGADYIYELQSPIVETDSCLHYATKVKSISNNRKAHRLLSAAVRRIDEGEDIDIVQSELAFALDKLDPPQENNIWFTTKELETMELPHIKWYIPDMLCQGVTLLAGPPKIGKSYFCWNMALAIAQGGVVFSDIKLAKPHNVSYLSFEDPQRLLKSRIEQMGNVFPDNLYVRTEKPRSKFDRLGLAMLKRHIDETNSEVIIIDTWAHVAPVVDKKGSSYDIEYEMMMPIQRFANDNDIAIVIVTHTRKAADPDNPMNEIQGSTAMQAAVDTKMLLSHDSGAMSLQIKGRYIPPMQYAFTMSDGVWRLEGDATDFRESNATTIVRKVMKEFGEEGLAYSDLKEMVGNKVNENTLKSTLRRMDAAGEIEQPKIRGKYFPTDDGVSL